MLAYIGAQTCNVQNFNTQKYIIIVIALTILLLLLQSLLLGTMWHLWDSGRVVKSVEFFLTLTPTPEYLKNESHSLI